MKRDFGDQFERLLKALKRDLPIGKPVRVVAVTQALLKKQWPGYTSMDGDCLTNGKDFRIRIRHDASGPTATETLIHEYAHCLVPFIHHTSETTSHTDEWGVAYARCYRVYESL